MCGSIPICCVCLKTSLEYIDLETPFDVTDEQAEFVACGPSLQSRKSLPNRTNIKTLTYLDCFKECTRLDMIKDEKRPHSLCSGCGFELKIAYEFIRKAINAAEILEQKEILEAVTKIEKCTSPSVKDKSNLMEDDMTKFTDYEEILDETCTVLEIESDQVIDDVETEEDVQFTCEYCEESFHSASLLSKHTTAVHGDFLENNMDYDSIDQCENDDNSSIIEVNFMSREELVYENSDKNEELQLELKMDEENMQLNGDNDAGSSASKGEDETVIKCPECSEYFTTNQFLQLHHRTKHKMVTKAVAKSCEVCKKIFITDEKQNYRLRCEDCEAAEEIESKDNENEPDDKQNMNFICNICSKTFATQGFLNAHLKYHQRKQANIKSDACNICGKQYSTKHYLRLHMQVHTNDRALHKCDECDKLYVTKTALDNHMKLHKGETIKCALCHKEFSRQYELNVHMRFHTRDYPFECEICGKKFAIKGHLRTHMWRHQGLKLQCEDCGKLFTSSKALQEHSFTHSEMPFPCSYCVKAYPSRQKYKVHLRTAHSLELNEEELQKIARNISQKPLLRKKLTLVQADSVMKEVEVKTKDDDNEEVQDIVITLF